jgi:hypothetical protein
MDWQIIISLITLALVIFGVIWGNGLWARRERVKIKFSIIAYSIDTFNSNIKIQVRWAADLQRFGGRNVRYTRQILIKSDIQKYSELCEYFNLPGNGVIEINEWLKLMRDDIVSPYQAEGRPNYPVFSALQPLPIPSDPAKLDAIRQIASELNQKAHKVCLVWDDGRKTKWKRISQKDYGSWVKL